MSLFSSTTFPTAETLSAQLPQITLDEWQTKLKYKKTTKFVCGWRFSRGGLALMAGWEPTLKCTLGWGIIPERGCAWSEATPETVAVVSVNKWAPCNDLFESGPKTVEELNLVFPPDRQINTNTTSSMIITKDYTMTL
jgi:hypothetical protein